MFVVINVEKSIRQYAVAFLPRGASIQQDCVAIDGNQQT